MRLDVLYLSDDNYVIFMGISIMSLLENNKNIDILNVFIIDDNISKYNKSKLGSMVESYDRKIIFLNMSKGIEKLKALKAPKYRGSYTTYLKLFAFDLLPDDVEKIFFIDSDTIINGSLHELINMQMDNKLIYAVKDGLSSKYKLKLGFRKQDSFYNMGIMLVDIKLWKKQQYEECIINQMAKRAAYVAVDQDLLNISFRNKIGDLNIKYNFTPHHYVYNYNQFMNYFSQDNYYTYEQVETARMQPLIYHFERFIGESPWNYKNVHPFAGFFDIYLNKSPWNTYKKKSAKKNFFLFLEKLLYRVISPNLFLPIFAIGFHRYMAACYRKLSTGTTKNIGI